MRVVGRRGSQTRGLLRHGPLGRHRELVTEELGVVQHVREFVVMRVAFVDYSSIVGDPIALEHLTGLP